MMKSPVNIHLQPHVRERQWCDNEIPVLEMKLSLPHCAALDRHTRRINRYYESFERSCEHYAAHFLFPAAKEAFTVAAAENHPAPLFRFHVTFVTHLLCDTLWSLTLETEEQTGSTSYRCRYADTWDLTNGYLLSLPELFPSEPLYRRRLRQCAREDLLRRQAEGIALHENWQWRLSSAWNRENFYLTVAGLHWFYPMYALGGAEMGIPSFFLPWNQDENPFTPLMSLDKANSADIS